MNYQVLARKWRPHSFEAMVGQDHVVCALAHALDQQRLHHAYLFTGTRGVGKTSLGRIFAKCLNCEQGVTSKPCHTCPACKEIASNRFIDLVEVDAASKNKVEDIRDLLDNVPYAPTSGRFKVYLIDEVHMLSTHSFNALLKTLEEPPPHIKFFLATTDPQKIPITVLSRCLQFHLKCLPVEKIAKQLAYILNEENISYEIEALTRLAYAAQGSMRDALSLLDQAIAFNAGSVETAAVKSMLCSIEASYIYEIVAALQDKKADKLIQVCQHLAEFSFDFSNVLEELLSFLHQIAISQFLCDAETGSWDKDQVASFSKISPQDIQLFYQIALIGRKDLPLAPTPRIGLEMVLLRMLAFQPTSHHARTDPVNPPQIPSHVQNDSKPVAPPAQDSTDTPWGQIVAALNLTGISLAIARNCMLDKLTEEEISLTMDSGQGVLLNKKQEERLAQALAIYFKRPLRLNIRLGESNISTPAGIERQDACLRKTMAKEAISQDPNVQKIIEVFNAKILPESIEVI